MDEMEKRLTARGKMLAVARDSASKIRDAAADLAREAHTAGISQHRIAELLGVDRMTVRKWIGK